MNQIYSFLIEVALTLLAALMTVAYLRPFLRRILIDLCGTEDRAQFWTSFSNILLIGLPMLISLSYRPEAKTTQELFFELSSRISGNLVSLLVALVGTGIVVAFFALVAPRPAKEKAEAK